MPDGGLTDRPIVRPESQNRMVTKGYQKGVYDRVTFGPGPDVIGDAGVPLADVQTYSLVFSKPLIAQFGTLLQIMKPSIFLYFSFPIMSKLRRSVRWGIRRNHRASVYFPPR